MSRTYEVEARWDSEAGVWVAESDGIPGFVAEAKSMTASAEAARMRELMQLATARYGVPKHA